MNQKENIQLPSAPIQRNIDLLTHREVVGLGKYGVTLGDAKLSHSALLQHGLEEALDLANYLQTALHTERENAKYKAEYEILLGLLQDHRRQMDLARERGTASAPSFRDLLARYEIEATRRGIRV